MESKVNYTIVGLFVVLLSAAMVIGGYWLTDGQHSRAYDTYIVYMTEAVSGLNEQSPVKFNGVKVGFVENIRLDQDNPQKVILTLKIFEGTPITESTVASLKSQGVTGLTYLGLKAETASAPRLKAHPGENYPVIAAVPSLLLQLGDAIRDLTTNMNSIVDTVKKVFDKDNRVAIKESLQNIATFSKTIADNSERLDKSLRLTETLLKNTVKASKDFPDVTNDLKQTLLSFRQASQEVKLTMQDSRAAMRTLSQQALPSTVQLINRLHTVAGNVQQLTQELQQNPAVMIRGKQPLPNGPGER